MAQNGIDKEVVGPEEHSLWFRAEACRKLASYGAIFVREDENLLLLVMDDGELSIDDLRTAVNDGFGDLYGYVGEIEEKPNIRVIYIAIKAIGCDSVSGILILLRL